VTREEAAWESFSEDEPAPKKAKPTPAPAAKGAAKKARPNPDKAVSCLSSARNEKGKRKLARCGLEYRACLSPLANITPTSRTCATFAIGGRSFQPHLHLLEPGELGATNTVVTVSKSNATDNTSEMVSFGSHPDVYTS
jgi:hypothetical protein